MGAEERTGLGSYVALDALRIAVVDDSAYFRNLVGAMLRAFGVRDVFEAATEERGFEVMNSLRPDVMLLDWNLGTGGNGATLLDRIRSHPDERIATAAVVLITAYSAKRHVLAAVNLGANTLILKPISARGLYDRLERLVTRRQLFERRDGRCRPIALPARPEAPDGDVIRIQAPRLNWRVKIR